MQPASRTRPALVGGLVTGVLSALPIIYAGNVCCCLWIVAGGAVAAYLLQQQRDAPIAAGDGALVGFQAGLVGAGIYLILSIPITFVVAPMERELFERLMERAGSMPPPLQEYVGSSIGLAARVVLGFVLMLVLGAIFSTVGGILGAVIFRTPQPREAAHQPPPPA
jgi:hypothetical protein